MLLERLCNECGVSGDEGRIREIIKSEITPYVDNITVDSMGNIIAFKKGKDSSKKVMMAAHMDEVGFIISGITDKGYLKFKTVGGIDTRVIISKKVLIGDKRVHGIIGMKAIHLQGATERENVPDVSDLTIDIGAKSKEDAKKRVSIGDYATFDTLYSDLGTDKVKAKALDDRVGCAALVEALKRDCEYDLYACFTTQEEVGLRGATVCAYNINPDIALVIEGTTCSDVYKCDEKDYVTKCGGGGVLSFMDGSTIFDSKLRDTLYNLAEKNNILVQYKKAATGGTDAGIIHKTGCGVKTAVIAVPCRYIHSPVSVASKMDIEAVKKFTCMFLENIGGIINGIA